MRRTIPIHTPRKVESNPLSPLLLSIKKLKSACNVDARISPIKSAKRRVIRALKKEKASAAPIVD